MILKKNRGFINIALILTSSFIMNNSLLAQVKNYIQTSPDKKIAVNIIDDNGKLSYMVKFNKKQIIKQSKLGMIVNNDKFTKKLRIKNVKKSKYNKNWQTVWGQNKSIVNNYQQIQLEVLDVNQDKMFIEFRIFNDGIAFRYIVPTQKNFSKVYFSKDLSQISINSHLPKAWYAKSDVMVSNEIDLNKNRRGDKFLQKVLTPFTVKLKNDCYISLHEAMVENAAAGRISYDFKNKRFSYFISSKQKTPALTPWRTVIIADKAAELITSNMELNLNKPNVIKDTSWIKPGKTLWDWRIHGAIADDGFKYGLNTESYLRYIDFAAKNNIQYVMVDAEWYGSERKITSDPTINLEEIDIPKICKYAKNKGIGIWLYVNTVGLVKYDLDRTFKKYQEWGVVGIKHGFLSGDSQAKIAISHKIMKKAADYKIMYILHEPNKPTGLRRTYPHYLSREFVNSMLDGPGRKPATPSNLTTFPFVHNLAGPVDRSCGLFDLDRSIIRDKVHRQLPTTVASQVAQCLIFPSGLLTLLDTPDGYNRKIDLFEFISKLPMTYDETKVINAEIGKIITIARRNKDNWFVSTLVDENGRDNLKIKLDFLEEDVIYDITLYEDAPNADNHFIGQDIIRPIKKQIRAKFKARTLPTSKRELYQIRKFKVRKNDIISAKIVSGGGHSMWIRPVK